jgi:hypothetical protein
VYISRAKMEEHLAAGGSVLHHPADDKPLTSVGQLPTEADLAAGDPKRIQAHVSTIDAEIAELTRKRTAMIAAAQAAQQSPPAGPKSEPAPTPAAAAQSATTGHQPTGGQPRSGSQRSGQQQGGQ